MYFEFKHFPLIVAAVFAALMIFLTLVLKLIGDAGFAQYNNYTFIVGTFIFYIIAVKTGQYFTRMNPCYVNAGAYIKRQFEYRRSAYITTAIAATIGFIAYIFFLWLTKGSITFNIKLGGFAVGLTWLFGRITLFILHKTYCQPGDVYTMV